MFDLCCVGLVVVDGPAPWVRFQQLGQDEAVPMKGTLRGCVAE